MVRSSVRLIFALTVAIDPCETQFLQSFTSSFSVSSWSSSGESHMIKRSWSSSPLGGAVEHIHETSSAIGGKVLQDVRTELVEIDSGTSSGTKDEVRCSGTLCEEHVSVIDVTTNLRQPSERPLIASGWRVPSIGAAPDADKAVPCHEDVPQAASKDGMPAMAAGDLQPISDGSVPGKTQPGANVSSHQKKRFGGISPEEVCGTALCGTALLVAAKLAYKGCRRKQPTDSVPDARLSMLAESPTSIVSSESPSPSFLLEENPCSAYVFRLYAREADDLDRRAEVAYAAWCTQQLDALDALRGR